MQTSLVIIKVILTMIIIIIIIKRKLKEIKKDLEIKDKSGASGSRCIGFSVKEAGRPIGATRN